MIAIDCVWYETYQGNELCSKHGCCLTEDSSPCSFCSDYVYFEGGPYEKSDIETLCDPVHYPADHSGQYYFGGM